MKHIGTVGILSQPIFVQKCSFHCGLEAMREFYYKVLILLFSCKIRLCPNQIWKRSTRPVWWWYLLCSYFLSWIAITRNYSTNTKSDLEMMQKYSIKKNTLSLKAVCWIFMVIQVVTFSSRGYKIRKKIPKNQHTQWNYWILRIGVKERCQKGPKSMSKIIRIKLFFHQRMPI